MKYSLTSAVRGLRSGSLAIAALISVQISTAENWSIVNSGTTNDIEGVTWDGVRFIAVDYEGGILQSTDGKSWSRKEIEIFGSDEEYYRLPSFYEIISGGGRYFALDSIGDVFESTDRNLWVERFTGQEAEALDDPWLYDNEWVNGGVYNNGSWVFVGESGTILKTTNGLDWTQITTSPTDGDLHRITFGNGLYVASGSDGIFTSTNAVAWYPRYSDYLPTDTDLAFFGGRFVAISMDDVITSTSGTSWTVSKLNTFSTNAICGGVNGFKIVCDDGEAFSTTNGKDFTQINLNTTSDINDVAYGGGMYVAVGDRGLIRTFKAISPQPEISIQQPKGSNLNDGTAKKSFGTVNIGVKSVVKTFSIKNLGTAKLTGLAITKNGSQAKDFIVTAPAKTTLAAGTSTTFKVTFKPTAKGTRNAAIHIKSNDSNESPFDIKLTGLGVK